MYLSKVIDDLRHRKKIEEDIIKRREALK